MKILKTITMINEPGLIYNGNELTINFKLWTTQAELAKKLGVSGNVINNRVRRGTVSGAIKSFYIKELGNRIIPNVNNINELSASVKKSQKKS